MQSLKTLTKKIANMAGYELVRSEAHNANLKDYNPYSRLPAENRKVVDLDLVSSIASTIPGMISKQSGELIYTLCYFQKEKGDVAEIGSWQGRSASFLARATHESGNGNFYAIDHFKGNPGREHYYVVEKDDLSDLKQGFVNNLARTELADKHTLLDMPNDEAVKVLADKKLRMLFIDGDHSKEGVQKDVNLFFPLLIDGALVVFDDYSKRFTGMMEVVDDIMKQGKASKVMTYPNSLVIEYRK